MTNPYGGQPPRPPYGQPTPRPPGQRPDTSKRNTWIAVGAAAVTLLCCCGGLGKDFGKDAAGPAGETPAITTTAPDPRRDAIYTGEIKSVDNLSITVIAAGREQHVSLAHTTNFGSCSRELGDALRVRLAALLPVATKVTVVRAKPEAEERYLQSAFIHTADLPAAPTAPPASPSINEQLIAEGSAALDKIDRTSQITYGDQVAAIRAQTQPTLAPYIDAIARADTTAWDNRLGAIGSCRTRLDQEAEERRTRWGPDEKFGTDDDPKPTYPSLGDGSSGGSGGGGGGRRRCGGRFC
ncbi:hypothetical protein IU418_21355 [Nocardia farcinica]|uniref:hypothetical protein n=1 Tax=Nocardia farcinica TaxID=37329 RepID=UPI001B3C959A|nr:hypothetical protein [Nocardia farcinica]MBF6539755.1 hypothetical protein [Nocardia farcinica]